MISKKIHENKEILKKIFNNTSDMVLYEFTTLSNDKALIGYINGTIDRPSLNENLLKPLIKDLVSPLDVKSTVHVSPIFEIKDIKDAVFYITGGGVILFIEGLDLAYIIDLGQFPKRQIEQPTTEVVVRGPKDAFVEDITTNKTIIRGRIRSNNLVFEDFIVGEQTNTVVSIVYIKGIVKPSVLEETRSKIKKIKVDKILDTGNIESYLDEKPFGLISIVAFSEKPDVVVSKVLEGSIAILSDGTPNVLTVPKVFVENLHSPEDYYIKPVYATFLRFLRVISYFLSVALPGIYVSLILFHQEMIPTELLISIAGQREGVPLSSPFEAMVMILFFELLKESAIRLPKAVGQAVTLVGGLVIGQAAVDAGVVSATMVIVVAATGMAEFVVPKLRESIAIFRIILLLLGSITGLYGVTLGMIAIISNMVSLKSFGAPYMWPIAPYDKEGIKDTIVKFPINWLNLRPKVIANKKARKRNERVD